MKLKFKLSIFISFLFLMSCGEKILSDKLSPEAIYFTMVIQNQSSDHVECYSRASVQNEYGNSVEFVDGDFLTCNGFKMEKDHDLLGNYIFYHATIPTNLNFQYNIKYFKSNKEYASSSVTSSEILSVQNPASGFGLNQNQDLFVAWKVSEKTSASMYVSASITFDDGQKSQILNVSEKQNQETGQLSLKSFKSSYPDNLPNRKLDLSLILRRSNFGTVSSKIKGHFEAVQIININGSLNP